MEGALLYMWLRLCVSVRVRATVCVSKQKRESERTRATFTNGLIDFPFESRGEFSDGRDWEVELSEEKRKT